MGFFLEQISDAVQSVDRAARLDLAKTTTQSRNQDLDTVGSDIPAQSVKPVLQIVAGDHLTFPPHQQFQRFDFARRKMHDRTADGDLSGAGELIQRIEAAYPDVAAAVQSLRNG